MNAEGLEVDLRRTPGLPLIPELLMRRPQDPPGQKQPARLPGEPPQAGRASPEKRRGEPSASQAYFAEQVTCTLPTSAAPMIPEALATVQAWPFGCAKTRTEYGVPPSSLGGKRKLPN